jgi:pyocin large subunit-like protein
MVILAFLAATLAFGGGPGFRTQHLLEEHYSRYGKEFGQITLEQYLHLAQQLRDAHAGKNILQSSRPTGGGAKFDRRRGWFVAYDGDGTLRTFFVPKDGIHFFESQARTAASPE